MTKGKRLERGFFERPTLEVARQLLGKFLVRQIGGNKIAAMITEAEAYIGINDKASHASRGRTSRTEIMFGQAGRAYVYMIYGMYHCLNVVTEVEGFPAAVLIRGVAAQRGGHPSVPALNGPGKLCRYFEIDRKLNNEDLIISHQLWIEDRGGEVKPKQVKLARRIGIDYAGLWRNKPWRFYISGYCDLT